MKWKVNKWQIKLILEQIKFMNNFLKENFENFSQNIAELKFKCSLQNEEIIYLRNKIEK